MAGLPPTPTNIPVEYTKGSGAFYPTSATIATQGGLQQAVTSINGQTASAIKIVAGPSAGATVNITTSTTSPGQISIGVTSTAVTAVTASGNLSSSGGTTPNIAITPTPTFTSVTSTNGMTSASSTYGPTSASINGPLSVSGTTITITSGVGAPTASAPAGSLWLRTDGVAGSRIYVNQGATTWIAIAGV